MKAEKNAEKKKMKKENHASLRCIIFKKCFINSGLQYREQIKERNSGNKVEHGRRMECL